MPLYDYLWCLCMCLRLFAFNLKAGHMTSVIIINIKEQILLASTV